MNDERIEDAIARVIEQFEDWKSCIEHSWQENDDFQALCEDYAVCARALDNWKRSDASRAVQRRQEYEELLAELGGEILDWLELHHGSDHADTSD